MEEVNGVLATAKGISDYGTLVMIGVAYLVLTAAMAVAMFRWFKSVIGQLLEEDRRGTAQQ